jgi:hypothetical protein
MKMQIEPGKRKAVSIAVLSSLALILGLAIMIAAILDYRVQPRSTKGVGTAFTGDDVVGSVTAQDGGFSGAGSEAGNTEALGEEARRCIGEETTPALEPQSALAAGAEPAAGGAEPDISCDLCETAPFPRNTGGMGQGPSDKEGLEIMLDHAHDEGVEMEGQE